MQYIDSIPVWGEHEPNTLEQARVCARTADYFALMADGHLGPALRQQRTDLVGRVGLSAFGLRETLLQPAEQPRPPSLQIRPFGVKQVERMRKNLHRLLVATASEFLLDALFHGGIKRQRHGDSIA